MVRLSKRHIDNEVLVEIYDIFFEALAKQRGKHSIEELLKGILSKPEKLMIAKRVAIVYLHQKSISAADISVTLKVSRPTIYKFIAVLESNQSLKQTLHTVSASKRVQDIFVEIINELHGVGVPGANWSRARSVKNNLEKKKLRGI